jgi:hypothetical protein
MKVTPTKPGAGIAPPRGTQPVVAWEPRRDLARNEWLVVGRRLGGISRCNQWWLGDWVRYGTERWGEKYTQAAKVTGYDPRTLANMASIAATFETSRRRDNLTWSHHVAVASLPEPEQETWLDRAVEAGFSVADLRTELRAALKQARDGSVVAPELVGAEVEPPDGDGSEAHGSGVCPRCGYRLARRDPE